MSQGRTRDRNSPTDLVGHLGMSRFLSTRIVQTWNLNWQTNQYSSLEPIHSMVESGSVMFTWSSVRAQAFPPFTQWLQLHFRNCCQSIVSSRCDCNCFVFCVCRCGCFVVCVCRCGCIILFLPLRAEPTKPTNPNIICQLEFNRLSDFQ